MSIRVSAAIMAHPKRAPFVDELRARLDRDVPVVWDERNDRWDTGRRSMLAYDPAATHHLVVQDDAVVCRDLIAGIERALPNVPEGVPLCLYVGRTRPYKDLVQDLVNRARGASWLVMDQLHWGVGVVMPTALIEDMVAYCDGRTDIPNYDRRMSRWLGHQGIDTWYPWPSLVNHRISPSLVPGRGHANRRAHKFIGSTVSALDVDWGGTVITVPRPTAATATRPGGIPPMLFICDKYPDLHIPSIAARFRDGRFEARTRQQIAYLQNPFMARRGVRLATDEEITGAAPAPEDPPTGTVSTEEPPATVDSEPAATGPTGDSDGEPDSGGQDTGTPAEAHHPVPDGTIAEIQEWVGDNPARARWALDAERERAKPRVTLIAFLELQLNTSE